MKIVGRYSFNGGREAVEGKYPDLLLEIEAVIGAIDAEKLKDKESKEKTMMGRLLYSPKNLNKAFNLEFGKRAWSKKRVKCEYPTEYYVDGYVGKRITKGAFREMDFIKRRLGVEVQFGKYSFMVYNVSAKMTIFKRLGAIDTGVEIVPVKEFAEQMSSGVSYFEQFVWDLEHRGVSDIDIPVYILAIDSDKRSVSKKVKKSTLLL